MEAGALAPFQGNEDASFLIPVHYILIYEQSPCKRDVQEVQST